MVQFMLGTNSMGGAVDGGGQAVQREQFIVGTDIN